MTSSTQSISNPPSKLIYTVAVVLCVICAISTLPWLVMATGRFGGFAWGLFGFELIVLLGCLMTLAVCMGKVQVGGGFPMAILCLIGTLLVGAVFGIHVDARAVVGDDPQIQPWINRTLMLRLGLIAFLSLLATLDVYRRDARSWGLMIRSALFLAPVLAVLGWLKFSGMPAMADSSGELSPARMVGVLLGGLVFGILLSIGGHFFIRSYEIAIPETDPDAEAAASS